jgi:hypothetical protein
MFDTLKQLKDKKVTYKLSAVTEDSDISVQLTYSQYDPLTGDKTDRVESMEQQFLLKHRAELQSLIDAIDEAMATKVTVLKE